MDEIKSELTDSIVKVDDGYKSQVINAIDLYSNGEYSKSLSLLLKISENNKDAMIYSCIGNCYKKMNQTTQARQYWLDSLKFPLVTASPYINLGSLYYEEGSVNKAILFWAIATTISPENLSALYNLAVAYNKKGYRLQSLLYYEKFIKFNKDIASEAYKATMATINSLRNTASTSNNIGLSYYNSHSYERAAESYLKSVLNYPLQPNINQILGRMYFQQKDYETAVKYWLDAYIVSDFHVANYEKLPEAYENLNMPSYAYCFYYLILNSSAMYNSNMKQTKSKLLGLTTQVYKDIDYSDMHYLSAKKYEEENNYHHALIEYKNALILTKTNKNAIKTEIDKMMSFVYPDVCLSESLVLQAEKISLEKNYAKAFEICDRVLLLARHNSETQHKAKKIRNECQNFLEQPKK